MIPIPANFSTSKKEYFCITNCGIKEDTRHIFECKNLNSDILKTGKFHSIYNDNMKEQIRTFHKLNDNFERRKKFKFPSDPLL